MSFVAFVVEENGKKGGGVVDVTLTAPNEYSRAVDDLVTRQALDDPSMAKMFAEHFAEVVISKHIAQDEAAANKAAGALARVMKTPFIMIEASRLRGDIEIDTVTAIDAKTPTEAELVWTQTLERLVGKTS